MECLQIKRDEHQHGSASAELRTGRLLSWLTILLSRSVISMLYARGFEAKRDPVGGTGSRVLMEVCNWTLPREFRMFKLSPTIRERLEY
jgi:hypothetical protein